MAETTRAANEQEGGAPPARDEEPLATVVDDELAARVREALAASQASSQTHSMPAAPPPAQQPTGQDPNKTVILERPLVVPAGPRTELLLKGEGIAKDSGERTEMSFALPERPRSSRDDRTATTRRGRRAESEAGFQRPMIVAHVIAPRQNYAMLAALLAWSVVVALAVYVVVTHKSAQEIPARAPAPPSSVVR